MTAVPAERMPVLVVLLLVQGAAGLLGAAVAVILALALTAGPAALPAVAGAVLPLLLAAGLGRGWRWARPATLAFELLLLAGYGLSRLLGLLPGIDAETGLVPLLANCALPAAVMGLLLSPAREQPV